MLFPIPGSEEKTAQLTESEFGCPSCGKVACAITVDYKTAGVYLPAPILGRITPRDYYLICNECDEKTPILPEEVYRDYEKKAIPWNERIGLALYVGFVLGVSALTMIGTLIYIDFF